MANMNYLDLYGLFVNDISGSEVVFLFLSFIVIAYLAARLKFPNIVTFAILAVYSLIISAFFQTYVLAITLLLVGVIFTEGISRWFS